MGNDNRHIFMKPSTAIKHLESKLNMYPYMHACHIHVLLPVGGQREAMCIQCRASDLGNLPELWDRSIGAQINWLHVRTLG